MKRSRKWTLAGVAAGCLVLFGGCGALIGSTTDAQSAPAITSTVTASPLPTVTQTAETTPVLVTAPAETSTAPALPPVTAPVPTVYVDAPRAAAPSVGDGGGTTSGGATSYENCDAVRAAGAAPLYAGEPGYSSKLDRDGDGVACEN